MRVGVFQGGEQSINTARHWQRDSDKMSLTRKEQSKPSGPAEGFSME